MARRVHTGKNVSEGLMLFYKMRILSVGPPSCSNLYLESSYPRRDLMPSPCRIKPLQLVPGQEHGAEAMAGSGPGAAAALHASDYSGPYQGLPASSHTTPNATVAGTVNVVAYAFSQEPVQEDPGSCHLAVVLWVPRALLSPATAPEG